MDETNVNVFGSRLDKPYYGCGMMEAVRRAFLKYAVFSGRASRGEFWWWWLFQLLVGIGVTVVAAMLMLAGLPNPLLIIFIVVPYIIWNLVTLVPNLAVAVRRLHDTNKSGWLVLIPAVPWLINFTASLPDALDDWRQTSDAIQLDRIMAQMSPEQQAEFAGSLISVEVGNSAIPITVLTGVLAFVGTTVGIVLLAGRSDPWANRFDKPDADL